MLAQGSLMVLGAPAFCIVFSIVIVLVLIQCGGNKEKENQGIGNEKSDGSYEKIVSPAATQHDVKPEDCTVSIEGGHIGSAEAKKRSSTLKSNTSNSSSVIDRPRQPTPLIARSSEKRESGKSVGSNEARTANGVISKNLVVPQQKQPTGKSESVEYAEAKPATQIYKPKGTEGSFETSGSGEELYTKVKPVPVKEECAYSVVEIAHKDTEYEMVDGKLQRTEKKEKDIKQNDEKSHYETANAEAEKPKLDPVLFAVEDSGASGIYEDVPETQSPVEKESEKKSNKVTDKEKNMQGEGHEEPKKKWGLTRFSLIKRNKGNRSQKDKHEKSLQPDTPGKFSLRGSNESIGHSSSDDMKQMENGNYKRQLSNKGHRPRTEVDLLPPIPPLENLKMKVEKRRTIHEADLAYATRLSPALDMARRSFCGSQTFYHNDVSDDALYEIPDKDVVSKNKGSTKPPIVDHHPAPKWPSSASCSPKMANRAVPKPPKEKVMLNSKFYDGVTDENYDMITADVDLSKRNASNPSESNSSKDPKYDKIKQVGGTDVDKNTEIMQSAGNNNATGAPATEQANDGTKIHVYLSKTMSSEEKQEADKNENDEIEAEEQDDTPPPVPPPLEDGESVGKSETVTATTTTTTNIEDLYAKVNMDKKREDQRIKELYAKVDKPKTGVKRYYYDNDVVVEEYEDGHYARISEKKEEPSHSYETFEEQKNLAMFQAIRPLHGSQAPPKASPKKILVRTDEYEDIGEASPKLAPSPVSLAKPSDDYEIISSPEIDKLTKKVSLTDDYQEIKDITANREATHNKTDHFGQKTGLRKKSSKDDDYLDIMDFPAKKESAAGANKDVGDVKL